MDDLAILKSLFSEEEFADVFPSLKCDVKVDNNDLYIKNEYVDSGAESDTNSTKKENAEVKAEKKRGSYAFVQWEIRPPPYGDYTDSRKLREIREVREKLTRVDRIETANSARLPIDYALCTRELLYFICPVMNSSLFVLENNLVVVADRTRMWTADYSMILHLVNHLLQYHEWGECLRDFLSTVETVYVDRAQRMPSGLQILYRFIRESVWGMIKWTDDVLKQNPPPKDFHSTRAMFMVCERVRVLYSIIAPLLNHSGGIANWDWRENQRLISSLLLHSQMAVYGGQHSWLAPLQHYVLHYILHYLDAIYDEGTVRKALEDDFLFYTPDPSHPSQLAVRPQVGQLFSDRMLTAVVCGADYRSQTALDDLEMISRLWEEKFPSEQSGESARLPIDYALCTRELLYFICPVMNSSLFVLENNLVVVADRTRMWTADYSMILHLVNHLLQYHEWGECLRDFLSTVETVYVDRAQRMPSGLQILYRFIRESVWGMIKWTDDVLKQNPPPKDFHSTRAMFMVCERVRVLYSIIAPLLNHSGGIANWDWRENQRLISSLLLHSQMAVYGGQHSWLAPLQHYVLHYILHYLDAIYDEGTVRKALEDDFLFYTPDPSHPSQLAVRPQVGQLFSDRMLTAVVCGADYRSQTALDDLEMISRLWEEKFPSEQSGERNYQPCDLPLLLANIEEVCMEGTKRLNDTLLEQLKESTMDTVLEEVKILSRGCFYTKVETMMAEHGDPSAVAFHQCVLEKDLQLRWMETSRTSGILRISLEYDRIVSLVLPPSLLSVLSSCATFYLHIYRALRHLCDVAVETNRLGRLYGSILARFRKMLFGVQHLLTTLMMCFDEHIACLLERHSPAVLNATSWETAKTSAKELTANLNALVDREGSRRMVHDSIDLLCKSAEDIRMALLSFTVTQEDVDKWQKLTSETRTLFIDLGDNLENNILNMVAVRLK